MDLASGTSLDEVQFLAMNPEGFEERLASETKRFREFSLADYLDECEGDGIQCDAVVAHAVPDPPPTSAAVLLAPICPFGCFEDPS